MIESNNSYHLYEIKNSYNLADIGHKTYLESYDLFFSRKEPNYLDESMFFFVKEFKPFNTIYLVRDLKKSPVTDRLFIDEWYNILKSKQPVSVGLLNEISKRILNSDVDEDTKKSIQTFHNNFLTSNLLLHRGHVYYLIEKRSGDYCMTNLRTAYIQKTQTLDDLVNTNVSYNETTISNAYENCSDDRKCKLNYFKFKYLTGEYPIQEDICYFVRAVRGKYIVERDLSKDLNTEQILQELYRILYNDYSVRGLEIKDIYLLALSKVQSGELNINFITEQFKNEYLESDKSYLGLKFFYNLKCSKSNCLYVLRDTELSPRAENLENEKSKGG